MHSNRVVTTHHGAQRRALFASVLALASLTHACSTRYLPPPQAPARVVPTVEGEVIAPRDGEGLVTLDAEGGAARAELITQRTEPVGPFRTGVFQPRGAAYTGATVTTRPLCVTPCTVALPFGQHEVLFSSMEGGSNRSSAAFINVGREPRVARHAMGFQDWHLGGVVQSIVYGALGVSAVLTGAMLMAFSGVDSSGHDNDLMVPGAITLGVGGALTIGAMVLGLQSRPENQPGATTQWAPSASSTP